MNISISDLRGGGGEEGGGNWPRIILNTSLLPLSFNS